MQADAGQRQAQDRREAEHPSLQRSLHAGERLQHLAQAQTGQEIGDEYAECEHGPDDQDLLAPTTHKGQVGEEEDDGHESTGVQAVDQPGGKDGQRTQRLVALDEALSGRLLLRLPELLPDRLRAAVDIPLHCLLDAAQHQRFAGQVVRADKDGRRFQAFGLWHAELLAEPLSQRLVVLDVVLDDLHLGIVLLYEVQIVLCPVAFLTTSLVKVGQMDRRPGVACLRGRLGRCDGGRLGPSAARQLLERRQAAATLLEILLHQVREFALDLGEPDQHLPVNQNAGRAGRLARQPKGGVELFDDRLVLRLRGIRAIDPQL